MTTAIRIILVDDHSIIRIGLKQILGRSPDLDVVGDAGNCEAAVALAKELLPEIALVDVNLPDVDGLETALRIGAVSPATRVALLSGAFSDRILKRGVAIGIRGFILKMEDSNRLAEFVRDIHQGGFCWPDGVRSAGAEEVCSPASSAKSPVAALNPRERAMLVELARGASLKEAAKSLGVRFKVADHIKQALMKKLDLHDRVELARFAMREGLIG